MRFSILEIDASGLIRNFSSLDIEIAAWKADLNVKCKFHRVKFCSLSIRNIKKSV